MERITILFFIVFTSLTLPTAWASSHIIYVPAPNGTDDTGNIQAALDACVGHGPRCTVQLAAGTYHTRQLVAYNFHGTFRGIATDRTTIEALTLPVTFQPLQPCQPNTTTCLWPDLMIFVDGDIGISDLSVHMTAANGTATAPPECRTTGIRLMGQYSTTNVSIDRLEVEGRPDETCGGFNLFNGIMYTGELSGSSANPVTLPCGAPGGFYFVRGSYIVRNSSFKMMGNGVSQDGCVRSTHVVIGGSPSTGNRFENVVSGIDLESAENSDFEVSYNVSSIVSSEAAPGTGMHVVPWFPQVFAPSKPSQYFIHDNKVFTTGQFAGAILLVDQPPTLFIDASVWNNTIEVQNSLSQGIVVGYTKETIVRSNSITLQNSLSEGIGVAYTEGTMVWSNSITGSDEYDAIGLYSSNLGTVINNRVSGVTIDSSVVPPAQIYLDPGTSQDFVLCATASDTVLNLGTENIVVRCQQQAAAPAAARGNVDPRNTPRMPRVHKGGLYSPR